MPKPIVENEKTTLPAMPLQDENKTTPPHQPLTTTANK
jgi:hypothetical protein